MAEDTENRPAMETRSAGGAAGTFLMAFVMIAVLAAACVVLGYFFYSGGKEAPKFTTSGFDLDDVKPVQQVDPNYVPATKTAVASPMPISGMPDMTPGMENQRTETEKAAAAGGPPPKSSEEVAREKREQEWLAKNGASMRASHAQLGAIAMRYYKNFPVVREVDAAFARMPRYMAIKARFDKDGNPYAFARGALALGEVRGEIARRMADPNVWRAAFGMINDTMKTARPPASVYTEAKRFMRDEPTVTNYMMNEFKDNATKNKAAISAVMGEDQARAKNMVALAQEIMPAMPQPPKR